MVTDIVEATTSPYFQRKRQRVRCGASPFSESAYFCSSATGAVQSLGPFLLCLSANHTLVDAGCTGDPETCQSCTGLIASARSHFECCSEFRKQYPQRSSKCCWLDAQDCIQKATRHLCPYKCYMRAYAPCRAWFALRSALVAEQQSGESVDKCLSGWRCILLPPPPPPIEWTDVIPSCHTSQDLKSFQPRTMFVDPEGKRFESIASVIRHIASLRLTQDPAGDFRVQLQEQWGPESIYATGLQSEEITCSKRKLISSALVVEAMSKKTTSSDTDTPYGFLEELFCDDPWKLLLSTIFLNRTTRVQVDTVLHDFLRIWPCASAAASATNADRMSCLIQPMGMRHRRAAGIIRFSKEYLELMARTRSCENETSESDASRMEQRPQRPGFAWTRQDILGLYYCGDYAYAAYQLFIQRNCMIDPPDHALKAYAEFQRGKVPCATPYT